MLPVNLATAAIIVTGASLLAGTSGGLCWLVATVVVYVLRSALNAWDLVVVEAAGTPRRP
jgi:type IV secretory pathway VirB2 component (pilin)